MQKHLLVGQEAQLQLGANLEVRGQFDVLRGVIGKGGMGEVYSAADTRLPRAVAIKTSAEQFSERFAREAKLKFDER